MIKRLFARFGSIKTFTELQVLNQYLSLNKHPYVMVYFRAKWNPACSIANQHVKLVGESFNKIEIIQVDSDVSPKIAKHYHVRAEPQFVLCVNGDQIIRQTGPNKDGLLQKCKKMLEIKEDSLTEDKWRPFGTSFEDFYKHSPKENTGAK